MLTASQRNAIESSGWFSQPAPEYPGFSWFLSGDPRFPAGILYPSRNAPFYDSNRPDNLAAEFYNCFNLVCQDVGFDLLSFDLAKYVKQDMEQRERQKASANRFHGTLVFDVARRISVQKNVAIGTASIPGVRLQWDHDGEAYCFVGHPHRSSLWSIRRSFDEISDEDFETAVDSFGWLKNDFFDSLPARYRFG